MIISGGGGGGDGTAAATDGVVRSDDAASDDLIRGLRSSVTVSASISTYLFSQSYLISYFESLTQS